MHLEGLIFNLFCYKWEQTWPRCLVCSAVFAGAMIKSSNYGMQNSKLKRIP